MLVRKKLKEGTEQWKKSPAELWTELCREVTQEVGAMGVVLLGKEDNFKRYGPAFDKFRPFYPTFFRFNRTLCNRRLATLPSIPRSKEADVQKRSKIQKEIRDEKMEKMSLDLNLQKTTLERENVKKEEVSIRNQIKTKEMESNRADLQKLANLPTRFTKTASGDNWLILNTVQDQNKELIIGFVSPVVLC